MKRWLPLMALIAAGAAAYGFGLHRLVSFDTLVARRADLEAAIAASPLVSMLAYVLVYCAAVALSIPGAVFITIAGGFLFGWKIGTILTVCGATLGAAALFQIASSSLGGALLKGKEGIISRLAGGFSDGAAGYLLFLRLTPVFPFALVNLAAAALGAPFRTFVWTTFLGIIPATTAFSIAGSGIGGIVAAQAQAVAACKARGAADCRASFDISSILTFELLAALCALGAVALIPVIARAIYRRKQPASQS